MHSMIRRPAVALAVALLSFAPALVKAEDKAPAPVAADKSLPTESTTQASITLHGEKFNYTAVAGLLTVGSSNAQDAQLTLDGKPRPGSQLELDAPKEAKDAEALAQISYVAYFKKDAKSEERPVTFIFNGGPGSSSVWLHMGSIGPKNVVTVGDKHLPAAPYKLVDNQESLLDVSDLVFVDMPGTGFGSITGKDGGKAFWGVDQDAQAFARFIQRFITKYSRWNSPKYIFGESYGTTRSAVLSDLLENDKNIDLNGVILLSQIFNFTTDIDMASSNPGVDLPFVTSLPTYAATAWYHKKLPNRPAELAPFLKEVESYATGTYAQALSKGADLSDAEKQQVAEKLHEYTGLPVSYLLKANLRVNGGQFTKNVLDDEDLTAGRLDTRYSGPSLNPLSESSEYDPQSSAISSAYVASFNDYVRRELKFGEGRTYLPESSSANSIWDWDMEHKGGSPNGLNVAPQLAEAMKTNPRLHVMVNGGYYDLATPYYTAYYEQKHLPIPQSLSKNIEFDWYEAGHMVYVSDAQRKQLHDRVAAFITKTLADGK